MNRPNGSPDPGSIRGADALMTQADTQDGYRRSKPPHDVIADSGVLRATWAWRNADAFGCERVDLGDRDFVVSLHNNLATQDPEILDEVVGKRVVVIDDQDPIHRSPG